MNKVKKMRKKRENKNHNNRMKKMKKKNIDIDRKGKKKVDEMKIVKVFMNEMNEEDK
jgi:hypothetical protein